MPRALAVLILIAGCNSGSARPSAPPRDGGVADAGVNLLAGKPMYLALCAPCHGAERQGYAADRAPSLNNPTFLESVSDEFLRQAIVRGRPATSMAAYGKASGGPLDDGAVNRLVAYLREGAPPQKALAPVTGGDVPTGAKIYAARCLTCHGDVSRRGEAIALVNPQFRSTASDEFVRHAIANGRPGTKMAPFAGALTDAEIDSVTRYVRQMGSPPPPMELLPAPTDKEPIVIHPRGAPARLTPRSTPCSPGAPCKPDARFVSVADVAKAYAAGQRMVIIDARPPSDWRRVHITGAVSIPYHDMKRLAEVPKDGTWIIAYCACPHHLSGIVVDELRKRGYDHAVVLDEGINEWHRRNLPVVAAPGVTPPLPEPAAAP